MTLATFLLAAGFANLADDAWQSPEQNLARKNFVKDGSVVYVLDIGFGAGYLAETLLESNPNIKVVSFESSPKPYTTKAKEYIDSVYAGRHTLILADQISQYINENGGTKFDVIFYDDRQEYNVARSNLDTGFRLAHEKTILVANNAKSVKPKSFYDLFLSLAWEKHVAEGKIIEINRKDFESGNRLIWGKYNLNFKEIKDLDTYLAEAHNSDFEGHTGTVVGQSLTYQYLIRDSSIKTAMEIGFNAGHSARNFLLANPSLKLVSFDIGKFSGTFVGKKYIDEQFPGRHTLIIGDSTKSVPQYVKDNPGVTFDYIFIDGGHDYETVNADLNNCWHLAHKNTLVVLDDAFYATFAVWSHVPGVSISWYEARKSRFVFELGFSESNAGTIWGRYNLDFYKERDSI